jgi:phosphofructokinase-like protein
MLWRSIATITNRQNNGKKIFMATGSNDRNEEATVIGADLDDRPRVGVLTSGGDCPGLNAVLRAVTKTGYWLGYQILGFECGFEGLIDPIRYRLLTPQNTADILGQGGTILGSTNKGRFAARSGVDGRSELAPGILDQVKETFETLQLEGLIVIGGDGSLSTALQFHEAGLNVVGVPKTIDNDLSCTAYTFGFNSAVYCCSDALDRLHTTAASHSRVMVMEVMGRHTGWIGLHGGIAGGADVILLPEIPWTYENIVAKIEERARMGRNFTLVVVSEGAQLPDGSLVQRDGDDKGGNLQAKLGGIGQHVTAELDARIDQDVRCMVLGHLQRGGGPTTFDRVLSTQYGAHAVRLVYEKKFGQMVCYDPPDIQDAPIADAVGALRTIDPDGSAVMTARAMGICLGDTPGYVNPFNQPKQA